MGLFDSTQRTESGLEVPGYMQALPVEVTNQMRTLMGQDYLSPDQLVADWSPALTGGVNDMIASGGGLQDISQALYGTGLGGLGGFGQGQDALAGVLGQGPAQNMGVDMGAVGGMIDNDVLNQQIGAALRDPYRNLTEQQMPAARLAQAASGNVGSSRGAIGEAILQRGYEDRAADIGGAMRGDAYRQALGIGGQQAAQNAGLQAQNQGLQANVGNSLINSAMMGGNMIGQGMAAGQQGFQNQIGGGQMQTGQQQALLDAGKEGFLFDYQMMPMFMQGAQGMGNTFGTRFQETQSDPGLGNTLLGGAMGLGGAALMGGMNPFSAMGNMFGGGNQGFDPAGMVPWQSQPTQQLFG